MRAPGFWDRQGALPTLLSPFGALYALATSRRVKRRPTYRAPCPVICVGNLNAGGTGKTPGVIAILDILGRLGVEAHVVTRGYGGSASGPTEVDPKRHRADQVGDEPLLLAAFARVWVARDRAAGAKAASEAGAKAIVLDDGFQNPNVSRDLSILVVDADKGFGNGLCIPAGPLREPVSAGMKRADMVLSIGNGDAQDAFAARWGAQILAPHITGVLEPLETGMDWTDTPFLAFAGIGYPEKFFATLRGLGATLLRTEALSDHQPLSHALMNRLEREAQALGAQLVTTEKDAVRLPSSYRTRVLSLPVRLKLAQSEVLRNALSELF